MSHCEPTARPAEVTLAESVIELEVYASDAALVTAACAGDVGAKGALFRRHVGMAGGIAYRLVGRDGDLEDIVQDSFAYAFATLDKLRRPQAFVAWLGSIVTGTAIATLRRRRLLARLGLLRLEPIELESLISPAAPPDVASELRAVYRVVDSLPTDERIVLILRRVDQLSLDEIAEQTGWSLATVKRRLTRAGNRVTALLDGAGESPCESP